MAPVDINLPSHQTAVIADAAGKLVVSNDYPLPDLAPDMLLVKTMAVALNPVDVKLTGYMATEGAVAGGDCAGVVVAIGSEVARDRFTMGDRVCAAMPSMDPLAPRIGAFVEYAGVTADFALKIPEHISFEQAATLGLGLATIGYALFRSLGVPGSPDVPAQKPAHVLVYGGSTASGTIAIQLLRRSGLIPITTCSPRNFSLVKSYGAETVFDYNDPNSAEEIRKHTKNALDYALDCFCGGNSMQYCYKAIGRAGGRYTTLEPYPEGHATRKRVKPEYILGPALLGRRIGWKEPYTIEANPELRIFGRNWFQCVQRLLDSGEIRPHPVKLHDRVGFDGILEGIELLRKKSVSGEKLVYRVGPS
ncbi:GroES-like protein [Hypoxylon sp. FL0890]|nr:GroES-like protein [Hypoxylon sp. FL0890]